MFIYFKIRYLEANELDAKQQVKFIRNYVEKICKLSEAGLKFKSSSSKIIKQQGKPAEISVVKYNVLKKADIKKIESIMAKDQVNDELLIFVSL